MMCSVHPSMMLYLQLDTHPTRGVASRVDAVINEVMEGEHASLDASRCCGSSFGGAASPDEDWGAPASPTQAGEDVVDAAKLQQIVDGMRRSQQEIQPWWLAAADGSATSGTGQQRAGKHARVGSGKLQPAVGPALLCMLLNDPSQLHNNLTPELCPAGHFQPASAGAEAQRQTRLTWSGSRRASDLDWCASHARCLLRLWPTHDEHSAQLMAATAPCFCF